MIRVLLFSVIVALLGGCSGRLSFEHHEPTLADLKPAPLPTVRKTPERVTPQEVLNNYRGLLAVTTNPEIKLIVLRRIADLEMIAGEERQVNEDSAQESINKNYYDLAISSYEALLRDAPNHPDLDHILYQLSKAYDLSGEVDKSYNALTRLVELTPKPKFYTEAQFRRGEYLFTRKQYAQAQQAYAEAILSGKDSPYFQNALYMHGWTSFKQNAYEASLTSFIQVLDFSLKQNMRFDDVSRAETEILSDTLRVTSLVFSYLDGEDSIANFFATNGSRHYEDYVYSALGELYLTQERFKDSAAAYTKYVDLHPENDQAPALHKKIIDAYIAGKFPSLIRPEKEKFARLYGVDSGFWQKHDEQARSVYSEDLKAYLEEIASFYHAAAQKDREPASFLVAANWYDQYVRAFPQDEKTPEKYFLMGETYYEATAYPEAIIAYETAAYDLPASPRSAEAGYAALLAYDKHELTLRNEEQTIWRRQKITSQLRFANAFSDDKRATNVLARATEDLSALGEYEDAISAANQLLLRNDLAAAQYKTAQLVIGLGSFELGRFEAAEVAYQAVVNILALDDPQRIDLSDRLAASVYKQAEQHQQTGDLRAAIDDFLRVEKVAPNSAIRINAKFDAATHLLTLKDYDFAIQVLEAFRTEHPTHELANEIPGKLAFAYQETKQFGKAASEVLKLANAESDTPKQRLALLQAGNLYEQAGDTDQVINIYTRYANEFPDPFDEHIEILAKLETHYREKNNYAKRKVWLNRIVEADGDAGRYRTERSKFLAATAQLALADDERIEYDSIKLTLPLKRSLALKKNALKKTLNAYTRAADYGIADVATSSTYQIAEVYAQLSRDLIDSDRPSGLNALEAEQYDILLEEQAFPFEEKAIEIHEANIQRTSSEIYDQWVKKSFEALAKLLPARYNKQEKLVPYAMEIR